MASYSFRSSATSRPVPRASSTCFTRRLSLWLCLTLCSPIACDRPDGGSDEGEAGESEGESSEESEKPTPIAVQKVRLGSIEAKISSASTIEAERAVTVHAEATGKIIKLSLEEGDAVKKGQLLARIRYESQSSMLARAKQSAVKSRADLERVRELHRKGVASQQSLEDAQQAVKLADMDQSDRSLDIRNTKVVAPFRGTLTERFVTQGAFVSNGAQLFALTDFDTLVARVYVPEKELDRIQVGQLANVAGKAARGRETVGTVQRIAPIVDAATGTVKVTVKLPNSGPEDIKRFLPGMYAEVTLTTEKREGILLVDKAAVVRDEEQLFVFVLEGESVKRVRVTEGLANDHQVEIQSGVEEGQTVVVAGNDGLKDGSKVVIVDRDGTKVVSPQAKEPSEKEGNLHGKPDVDSGESSAAIQPETDKPNKKKTEGA